MLSVLKIHRPKGLCDFLKNFIVRIIKTETNSYPGDDYSLFHKLRIYIFPLGSVYSTKASGAEQTTETNNSN